MARLIDAGGSRIEKDIGDPWKRTPHFVVDRDEQKKGNGQGVLYWPTPRGFWAARAFTDLGSAARFVDHLVAHHRLGQIQLLGKEKEK